MTEAMRARKAPGYEQIPIGRKAAVDAEIAAELKENRYREAHGVLTFTSNQAAAWDTIVDWRWWLIHLWVEGMFEVFAVVVIGFLMARLGLVTAQSTLRATYFQLIILLGSGIIGTGHHYY